MAEISQTLAEYSQQLKEIVKIKPQQFEVNRVATMITSLPERKWSAAQAVVNATIIKKDADRTVKTERATKLLLISKSSDKMGLSNAADRQAWVDKQPQVFEAELKAIDAEAELLAAKLAYECLDDLFTAGKKIMDYLVEQERATKQYNKYVDEGRRAK